jgi:hypothetical protein
MTKSAADLILILRNVTGRVDASDPQFTNEIMLQYLQDFIQLQSTQDIRIFKNRTWWEFNLGPTSADPLQVNLQTIPLIQGNIGASTIEPPCYADGFPVFWYQDPADFYRIWPETQVYTPQRPTYVLYYNNSLTFRGPPNTDYLIKIAAYQVELQITNPDYSDPYQGLQQDYLYRYVCYGAALDIFSDFGEMDKWNEIFPAFKRYRALVYSRTVSQYQNQRPNPEF